MSKIQPKTKMIRRTKTDQLRFKELKEFDHLSVGAGLTYIRDSEKILEGEVRLEMHFQQTRYGNEDQIVMNLSEDDTLTLIKDLQDKLDWFKQKRDERKPKNET